MRVKILTDTSCGISRDEMKSLGIEMIALPFLLDEIEYNEDKLTKDEFYKKLKVAKDIHTSTASMEEVIETIDEMIKDSDIVMYFPITSGLSSSYYTGLTIAEKSRFKDKLLVVNHKTISVLQRAMLYDVMRLLKENVDPYKIKELAEANAVNNKIYIAVDTLEYLKKGGRISSMSATIGTILNIKPVLFSNGNKFEVVKKSRGFKAAEEDLIDLVRNDLNGYFKDVDIRDLSIGVAYTKCYDEAKAFKEKVENEFKTNAIMDELSTVIGCHIGEGALALAIYKRIYEN